MTTTILAFLIVTLFLLAAVLSFVSGLKFNDWTGKLFFPVLLMWPLLWLYAIAAPDASTEIRQLLARWAFIILAIALFVWRAATLWLQTGKKWK